MWEGHKVVTIKERITKVKSKLDWGTKSWSWRVDWRVVALQRRGTEDEIN